MGSNMNLSRAKELLNKKGLSYELIEYSCEGDFWKHISQFSDTSKAAHSKMISLVINSPNKHKNLELQFNQLENDYLFCELWFGEYCFEAFDYEADILEQEILSDIENVISGVFIAFSVSDLKNRRFISDGLFEKNSESLEKFKQKMSKPKSWAEKIFKTQMQYELYDWDTHKIVIK